MDYKSIQELIKTVSDSKLTLVELETEGIKIKLEKRQEITSTEKGLEIAKSIAVEEQISEISKDIRASESIQEKLQGEKSEGVIISSPIVGTFYASPGPDANAFVTVGSKIKKGQVLCVIEAMKLMNEIQSEVDGEIVEIFAENEQMVEYGQPLFKVKA